MNDNSRKIVKDGLNEFALLSFDNAERHGFHNPLRDIRALVEEHAPEYLRNYDTIVTLGRLMLVVTELAEAAEAVRKGGDENNFGEEIADAMIRLADESFVDTYHDNYDIGEEVVTKMAINEKRPFMHGGKGA